MINGFLRRVLLVWIGRIGWKLDSSWISCFVKISFFRSGETTDCWKDKGTVPDDKERLTMREMTGAKTDIVCLRIDVGRVQFTLFETVKNGSALIATPFRSSKT